MRATFKFLILLALERFLTSQPPVNTRVTSGPSLLMGNGVILSNIANLNSPLVALSFLKINPIHTQQKGVVPEIDFANYLQDFDGSTQMLNTLGWAEAILVVNDTNLAALFRKIANWFPYVTYLHNGKYFADKTLTMIGHTLDVSAPGKKRVIIQLSEKGDNRKFLKVDCSLACKPRAMKKVEAAAIKYLGLKTRPGLRFGPTDLHFQINSPGITTINDLRERLDSFKRATADYLVRSHTSFEYTRPVILKGRRGTNRLSALINISPGEAAEITSLGSDGEMIATAIYRYGNLTQSDLSADAYIDLLNAVYLLTKQATRDAMSLTPNWSSNMAGRLSYLEAAINQRSQNVFLGLEENPFVTYPARMGVQRVFKGLEAFATLLMRRFGKHWPGFVCIGNLPYRFEHYAEYLVIPPDAIIQSTSHWAINHELMHVLENISSDILSLNNIKPYLLENKYDESQNKLAIDEFAPELKSCLLESMTDTLDYALCCPFDLEEYLRVVWEIFFMERIVEGKQVEDFEFYLYRSFAVICYDTFAKSRRYDAMMVHLETAKLLWKHIEPIKQIAEEQKLGWRTTETRLKIERIIRKFLEFLHFMPWIFNRVNQIKRGKDCSKMTKREWLTILDKLTQGILLNEHDLAYPDAISWNLRSQFARPKEASNRINITWLLSLWDIYQTQKLGPDLSRFISPKDRHVHH